MKTRIALFAATTTLVVGALSLTGCEAMRRKQSTDTESTRARIVDGSSAQKSASEASARLSDRPGRSTPTSASTGRTSAGGYAWHGQAFPTGDESTSAVLLRKGVPSEVQANQDFEYVLEVTNLTDHSLEDVVVEEQLSEQFQIKRAQPALESSDKGTARWAIGKLAAGKTQSIRVFGSSAAVGEIRSCATVSYASRVCSTIAVVQPAIEITKVAPSEALLCDKIPVKYVVRNNGSGVARGIQVSEDLPSDLQADNKRPVRFSIDSLRPGQSREFVVNLNAGKIGSYSGAAVATASGNLKATSKPTTTVVRSPDLRILNEGPERSFAGRDVTHTVSVRNVGDAPARDLLVEQSIPSGAKLVSASDGGRLQGGKVVWRLGSFAPKAERKLTAAIRTDRMMTLKTTATANARCAQAVTASAATQVVGIPAILLEVVDAEDPIAVGDDVTYEIRVTNQGSAAGTNIKIETFLEDSMKFVSSSGPTRGSYSDGGVNFAPLASLGAKDSVTWKVVVKAVAENDARFKVRMTSDQINRPVDETEATNFYK